MKTIGLIGGMSWESTAVYYRLLNEMARERLGGLHSADLVLRSFDFAEIEALQAAGDWARATEVMAEAGRALARADAACILICTNTMHKMADNVAEAAGLPVLHIADVTAVALRKAGVEKPLLLATRYTMEQDFYVGRLRDRHGIEAVVPDAGDRETVQRIIYDELCLGVFRDESRQAIRDIARREEQGVDGVIFGCTEIGMLVSQDDFDVPAFDTTRLHAAAALDFALKP